MSERLRLRDEGWQEEVILALHEAAPAAKIHFAGLVVNPWLRLVNELLDVPAPVPTLSVVFERHDEINFEAPDMRKRISRQQIVGLFAAEEVRAFCAGVSRAQPATLGLLHADPDGGCCHAAVQAGTHA